MDSPPTVGLKELAKIEMRMLEALRYKLSFFGVHQQVKFLLQLVKKKYGVDLNVLDVYAVLKNLLCTDIYFLCNPVVVCVYAVFSVSANYIVRDNFFKIFMQVDLDEAEIKSKVLEFEKFVKAFPFPTPEEIGKAVKRFEEITKIPSLLKRGSMAEAK